VYSHVLAEIDISASMTMTPHASLIRAAQQCNMSIKMADGSVLNSNIQRGFLNAACNGKLLPKIEALHVPDLAATLISSPQLVSEGKMDMVHSKHYGSFMQPACDCRLARIVCESTDYCERVQRRCRSYHRVIKGISGW